MERAAGDLVTPEELAQEAMVETADVREAMGPGVEVDGLVLKLQTEMQKGRPLVSRRAWRVLVDVCAGRTGEW